MIAALVFLLIFLLLMAGSTFMLRSKLYQRLERKLAPRVVEREEEHMDNVRRLWGQDATEWVELARYAVPALVMAAIATPAVLRLVAS